MFKARNKPFVLVFWSRDPDGTQHNQGDSLNSVTPGINGPSSLAAIKNADNNLAQLAQGARRSWPRRKHQHHRLGRSWLLHDLEGEQDQSDREEHLSGHARRLPAARFLALDLSKALDCRCSIQRQERSRRRQHLSKGGNGLLGKNPLKPDLVVATNGGSDLVYLPNGDRKLAGRTVKALLEQDYVSGIFVEDSLGRFPGTLPLSLLNLKGKAVTPHPAIVVNFRSYSSGCDEPTVCSVEIADTVLRQGQGMHGSFSRGDTMNFMAAIGPDFKTGFASELPVSNADVGITAAKLLGLNRKAKGVLIGRVMTEAMPNASRRKDLPARLRERPRRMACARCCNSSAC